jgi:hypothetical protein
MRGRKRAYWSLSPEMKFTAMIMRGFVKDLRGRSRPRRERACKFFTPPRLSRFFEEWGLDIEPSYFLKLVGQQLSTRKHTKKAPSSLLPGA